MWARLESNTIKEILTRPKALTIGGVQYPSNIFGMWSNSELAVIGIVPVEQDNTNFKNQEYYINTEITYAYDTETGKATGTYGSPTARAIADTLYTQADEDAGYGTKDKVKEILGRSPDMSDAIMMRMYYEIGNTGEYYVY